MGKKRRINASHKFGIKHATHPILAITAETTADVIPITTIIEEIVETVIEEEAAETTTLRTNKPAVNKTTKKKKTPWSKK
jgi:hypothetical protein